MLPPLVAFLTANISEFKAKMIEAGAVAEATAGGAQGKMAMLAGAGKVAFLGVAAGAALAGGVMVELAKHAEETGQAAYEMKEKFGLSGQQASLWIAIGAQVGVGAGSVSNAFRFLTRNMENVNLSFKAHAPEARAVLESSEKLRLAQDKYNAALKAFGPHSDKTLSSLTSLQHAQDAYNKLTDETARKLSPAGQALQQLGIRIFDTTGKLRNSNDVMHDAVVAFGKMEDGPEKAGLAMKIFGRSGQDLIPLLNQGKEGLDKLSASAQKNGSVMSNEAVDGAHQAFLAHKQFDSAVTGLTTQLSIGLLPIMTKAYTWLAGTGVPAVMSAVNWMKQHQDIVKAVAATIAGPLVLAIGAWTVSMAMAAVATLAATWPILVIIAAAALLGLGIYMLIAHWKELSSFLTTTWTKAIDYVKTGLTNIGTTIAGFFTGILTTAGNAWSEFASRPGYWIARGLVLASSALGRFLLDLGAWALSMYVKGEAAFRGFLTSAAKELIQLAPQALGFLLKLDVAIGTWAANLAVNAAKAAIGFVVSFNQGVQRLPGQLIAFAIKFSKDFVDGVISALPGMAAQVGGFFSGLGTAVNNIVKTVTGKVEGAWQEFSSRPLYWIARLVLAVPLQLVKLISAIGQWAAQLFDSGRKAGSGFGDAIMKELPKLPGQIWTLLQNIVGLAFRFGSSFVTSALSSLPSLLTGIGSFFSGLGSAINARVQGILAVGEVAWKEFSSRPIYWITRLVLAVPLELVKILLGVAAWVGQLADHGRKAGMGLVDSVMKELPKLPGQLWALLQNVAGLALQFGKNFASNALASLGSITSGIGSFFSGLGSTVHGFVTGFTDRLEAPWKEFSSRPVYWITRMVLAVPLELLKLLTGIVAWSVQLAVNGGKAFGSFVTNAVKELEKLPGQAWTLLQSIVNRVASWGQMLLLFALKTGIDFTRFMITELRKLPNEAWSLLQLVINRAAAWGQSLLVFALKTGISFVNAIVTTLVRLPGQIWNWLVEVDKQVTKWTLEFLKFATNAAVSFLKAVISEIQKLPGQLWALFLQLISKVADLAKQFATSAKNAGAVIVTQLMAAVQSLPGQLLQFGKNLVQGLINGIASMGGAVKDALKQVVQGAIDQAKATFGIHSPSSVAMAAIGTPLGQAVPAGILGQASSAAAAMKSLVARTLGAGTGQAVLGIGFAGGAPAYAGSYGGGASSSSGPSGGVVLNANYYGPVATEAVGSLVLRRMAKEAQRKGLINGTGL